jgi:hypothetical protein
LMKAVRSAAAAAAAAAALMKAENEMQLIIFKSYF